MKFKLLLVLPLFLIIGCLPNAGYEIYQNEEIGFKIKYPNGWEINQITHKAGDSNGFEINFYGPRLRSQAKHCYIDDYSSKMEITVSDYWYFKGKEEGISNVEVVEQYMEGAFDSFVIEDNITVLVRKGAFGASPACYLGEYTVMFYNDEKGFVRIQLAWDYDDYEKAKEIFKSFEFTSQNGTVDGD
jgi:hypothetical protein